MQRRIFIKQSAALSAGIGLAGLAGCGGTTSSDATAEADTLNANSNTVKDPLFKISLAEWSFHRTIFNPDLFKLSWTEIADKMKNDYAWVTSGGQFSHLDFPAKAREMGFEGVEFVNTFFYDKAHDEKYLSELKDRCQAANVQPVLIMCDQEGDLGAPNEAARVQAAENHHKWVDAAQYLGCHSIRVNARSEGGYEEQQKLAADGLDRLAEYADQKNINIIVENHGGLSSNGKWLAGVMKLASNPRVGTLPDFGNFCVQPGVPTEDNPQPGCTEMYDRYEGVKEMMPYAQAVSAKTHEFDAEGSETKTDYEKMMKIVLDAGYRGFVGVEYEGQGLGEAEGTMKTKQLLERIRQKLAPQYS